MTVALSVEIKRIGQDMQAYLKAEIFVDGFADEVIELTYRNDYVTLVYEGKMMRVPVSQLQQIAAKTRRIVCLEGGNRRSRFAGGDPVIQRRRHRFAGVSGEPVPFGTYGRRENHSRLVCGSGTS